MPAVSRVAWAQTYPSRPVLVVVPFAAGGPGDIIARLMGQWLSERLGQPFIIENRPGAGTNIATEAPVRAPSDGYTLLWANAANAVNAALYQKLSFDFIRDITPVAGVARIPRRIAILQPSRPSGPSPPARDGRRLCRRCNRSRACGRAHRGTPGAAYEKMRDQDRQQSASGLPSNA